LGFSSSVSKRGSLPSAFMRKMPGLPLRLELKAITPPPLPVSGGREVAVGGTGVAVGGMGVADGAGVSVGGAGVAVGTDVLVGGT
jgi:hypothetical protein